MAGVVEGLAPEGAGPSPSGAPTCGVHVVDERGAGASMKVRRGSWDGMRGETRTGKEMELKRTTEKQQDEEMQKEGWGEREKEKGRDR